MDDEYINELKLNTEKILESQHRILRDISEIKRSLFDPDEGLYARVGLNTQFRLSAGKWLWILTTGLTLALARIILNILKM